MKLFLLKILFINRPKEKGYVIPVVFALGLIMTLIGMISVFQSSDEQVISISKRESSKALAAAETGVARYREQINKYKIISMHDACNDSNWGGDETCDDVAGDRSWATANQSTAGVADIRNLDTYCPEPGSTTADNDDNVVALATRAWQNIGADASQGQYRLIDYDYQSGVLAGDGTYDSLGGIQPKGTLTVEGRVNQQNTNLANEPQASVASIEVDLAIQPGLPNPDRVVSLRSELNDFDPALWLVEASNDINLGSIEVDGNIIVTDTDCVHNGDLPEADDFADSTENTVIVDPRAIRIVRNPNVALPDRVEIEKVREVTLADLTTSSLSLPLKRLNPTEDESSDIEGDTVYYYKLVDVVNPLNDRLGNGTDLNLNSGDTLAIRDDIKVVLFVEGDINITAGASDININNNPINPNDSSHLEIYMVGRNSRINFSGTGNVIIKALIHAPESTVDVLGDPNVDFTGAMWVKDFNGKTLTNAFRIKSDDRYFNYTYVYDFQEDNNIRIADPIISPPEQWNTQQVDN